MEAALGGSGARIVDNPDYATGLASSLKAGIGALPPDAAALVESLLDHLVRGARVAVLAEDRELSPNEAATILGLSRPLVVHRMETGDLPFRYVGAHRRTRLRDVLALKARLDAQQTAVDALAGETETLMRDHGL